MNKRLKRADTSGINKLVAEIVNNPTITTDQLMRKAVELGYDPADLIDAALGSVKYDKSKASLDKPLEDILNDVYESDVTPGKRYVMEPTEALTSRGKDVAKNLEGNLGVATSLNIGKARSLPDYVAVRPAYTEMGKLKSIAHAGHELGHQQDYLIRPDFKMQTTDPYKSGHHYKEIYEPAELIREARDLPQDEKAIKEVIKQSKKAMLKPSMFTRLRSLLGPIAAGTGLYSALKSGDVSAAALNAASLVDPTGISDAALEVKNRLNMSPEEQEKISKEDRYSAMPMDLANEQRMLDELENYAKESKFKKIKEKVR